MENTNKIEPKTIICNHCGNEFTMSPAEQKYYESHEYQLPKKCPECRKLRKEKKTLTCIDCNAEFEINAIQESYYKENGYELPKRCPECRKFKRARNEKGDE